ncbi:tRNA (uridine(34)/cytosine(34)/5-carboxymethylaminomethyluridine(34)-2'-O)-methyltransferase TrmL [Alicyclobacillus herbarius]|uniref:tRNA (uridine(34)/cytosine(34)/5- carboxymethylaminomethyluridine(34)-2'-O)- methyltransferase TrmL n=1 Tax=Alicyclobacillus herbarius TaxID=122960 RepID=UPI0003F7D668|nr:tRNA (uridine(34)/cytosine(34)/5-carboxymethylaminomethyluridine(34)-2'-O)-methyltransferase TrmL [Alicyclobacillus herbarius]
MHVVLVEPEIPGNTGNIARTCAATGSVLHLVRPLGFSTEDRYLKRAGLDYWHLLDIRYHDSLQEVWDKHPEGRFIYTSTRGRKWYSEIQYQPDDFLVFGKETAGLPQWVIDKNLDSVVRMPMIAGARSLNLANSVAIIVYEALRQCGFPGLT